MKEKYTWKLALTDAIMLTLTLISVGWAFYKSL